jgi:hypothetical protein
MEYFEDYQNERKGACASQYATSDEQYPVVACSFMPPPLFSRLIVQPRREYATG